MSDTPKEPAESQAEEHTEETETLSTLAEMEQLRSQLKEYKDKYLRSLADSENSRRRLQKEKQDLMRYAIEQVICDLLHPIDNMENALRFADQGSEEVRNWSTGFQMILTQFKDALTGHGVSTFTSQGTHFDPHHHEAVEIFETEEHPEGTVVEEFVKGYKLGDKTIRPARVKVAKRPQEGEEQAKNNTK